MKTIYQSLAIYFLIAIIVSIPLSFAVFIPFWKCAIVSIVTTFFMMFFDTVVRILISKR